MGDGITGSDLTATLGTRYLENGSTDSLENMGRALRIDPPSSICWQVGIRSTRRIKVHGESKHGELLQ